MLWRRNPASFASRIRVSLAIVPLLTLLDPASAGAAFHLNEISKIMVGYNGDQTVQAIEIKMLASGENFVSGASIKAYDAAGTLLGTLGTFTSNVPNGIAGRSILCATSGFASTFGITPDLLISPGIPVYTGQISFENTSCFINAIAYGAVTAVKNGTTKAAPIPADGATVLARAVDDLTSSFCPLSEDANARFALASGSSGSPVPFSNNAGVTVGVFTTVTGVDGTIPAAGKLRVFPNPIRGSATIEAPGWDYLAVYDVWGRRVRSWGSPRLSLPVVGPRKLDWDGTDSKGQRLATGIYFVQYGLGSTKRARIIILR